MSTVESSNFLRLFIGRKSNFFTKYVKGLKVVKMVEETANNINNKPKQKTNKPKSVYEWSARDVQNWLRRHCSDYHPLYAENFVQHDITGRALIRMNDNSLVRLGIADSIHREAIWREILRLRLKTDIIEIRDLQFRTNSLNYEVVRT